MGKILVEFINTCVWCNKYGVFVEEHIKKYNGKVELKVYRAGKDFEYIKKYGMVMKSMIVINEKKKIQNLSEGAIIKAIEEAVVNS